MLLTLTGTKEDCLPWGYAQCQQNNAQPGDPNSAGDYEACAEVFVNAPCGCLDVCGPPSPGALAVGDDCMDDAQCVSGVCRNAEAYIECGTCWTRGLLGEECFGLDVECDEGLYCANATGACETLLADGETRSDSDACASDVCYGSECIPPLGLGDDCSGDGGSGACDLIQGGLWCDPGTEVCAPFPIGGLGDACGLLSQNPLTLGFCAGNLVCSEPFPAEGTCVPRDALGDACTLLGDQPNESTCLLQFHCVGGECVVPVVVTCGG